MALDVLAEMRRVGRALPAKAPPIPIGVPELGLIGHAEHRRGLYINSAQARLLKALLRDQMRLERAAREVSGGRFGAEVLAPIAARMSDRRDGIAAVRALRGAITGWDAFVAAKAAGKWMETAGTKTLAASNSIWTTTLRSAGYPAAMTYGNIPGPAALDSSTTGAWPLPMQLGASDNLYLTNVGLGYPDANTLFLAVDVLQAAGNVLTSISTSQNVSTAALPRWTGGAGLQMTIEATASLGATAANVTVNYVNQSGATSTTPATAMTTSDTNTHLVAVADGPMIRFAAGDHGVRTVNQVTLSSAMGATSGAVALLIYKPLVMIANLIASNVFLERSTPVRLGGASMLTEVAQGSKPCLGLFYWHNTASVATPTLLLEFIWG